MRSIIATAIIVLVGLASASHHYGGRNIRDEYEGEETPILRNLKPLIEERDVRTHRGAGLKRDEPLFHHAKVAGGHHRNIDHRERFGEGVSLFGKNVGEDIFWTEEDEDYGTRVPSFLRGKESTKTSSVWDMDKRHRLNEGKMSSTFGKERGHHVSNVLSKDDRTMGRMNEEIEIEPINVEIDEGRIWNLIEDFKNFGVMYWTETEDEREDLLVALKDAYANTAAKLLLNFGKVVTPVAERWADIMQYVQVNPNCNQKCAMNCMSLRKRDTMFFDQTCLASCQC